MPPQYAAFSPVVQQSMMDALHATIEPCYRAIAAPSVSLKIMKRVPHHPHNPNPCTQIATMSASLAERLKNYATALTPCSDMLGFLDRAMPMLHDLGIFIHKNVALMTKVARICATILTVAHSSPEGTVMQQKVREKQRKGGAEHGKENRSWV